MKNIETKNITIPETPETDEANKILNKQKAKIWTQIICIVLLNLIGLIICLSIKKQHNTPLITWCSIFILCIIICFFYYIGKLRPYKGLLRLAKANDKLRHEARIRYRERKRLEEEEPTIKPKQTPVNKILPPKPPKPQNKGE